MENNVISVRKVLTLSVIVVLGVMTSASLYALLFPADEAYAPSSRRGFMCDWRTMDGWAGVAMPFPYMQQQNTMT